MPKLILFQILLFIGTGFSSIAHATPSRLDLACAARYAYQAIDTSKDKNFNHLNEIDFDSSVCNKRLSQYQLLEDCNDQVRYLSGGFRGIVLSHIKRKELIIAFRGTERQDYRNLLADSGILMMSIDQNLDKKTIHSFKSLSESCPTAYRTLMGWNKNNHSATQSLSEQLGQCHAQIGVYSQFAVNKLIPLSSVGYNAAHSVIADSILGAEKLYQNFHKKHPRYKVYLTGHSLGGFLAQIVAAKQGVDAITFSAPGAREYFNINQFQIYPKFNSNRILNIFRESDPIAHIGHHIGKKEIRTTQYFHLKSIKKIEFYSLIKKEDENFKLRQSEYKSALKIYQENMKQLQLKKIDHWSGWASVTWDQIQLRYSKPKLSPHLYRMNNGQVNYHSLALNAHGILGFFSRNHNLDYLIEELKFIELKKLNESSSVISARYDSNQ